MIPLVYPDPRLGAAPSQTVDTKIKSVTEVTRAAVLGIELKPSLLVADVSITDAVATPENSYSANSTCVRLYKPPAALTVVLVAVGIDAALAM